MTGMTALKVRPEHLKGIIDGSERRRYKRYSVTLLGRFMRVISKEELTCRLIDISVGGANLVSDVQPQIGEKVIVCFEELGGLEGEVTRVAADGFAVKFTASHRRRQKLAAQITWLINRHELAAADQRRPGHERVVLTPKPVRVEFEDGTIYHRNIIDVSISGASVDISERPPIGSKVTLGTIPAKVVRHHERGIGVEFAYIQELETIREDFG